MGACCCCCNNVNAYRMTALRRADQRATDMAGKVVVVTGAAGSLGMEISGALYTTGATVVLAGRSMRKLEEARTAIAAKHPTAAGLLVPLALDLSDYASILAFAAELRTRYGKVNVLVNNAGLVPTKFDPGKYGYESTFQTNYLSTYVLTEALLPLLEAAGGGARVVNVPSLSHYDAPKPIDWAALPRTKETYGGYNVDYCERCAPSRCRARGWRCARA
jgi:protochlorophyllide reductase